MPERRRPPRRGRGSRPVANPEAETGADPNPYRDDANSGVTVESQASAGDDEGRAAPEPSETPAPRTAGRGRGRGPRRPKADAASATGETPAPENGGSVTSEAAPP